MDVIKKFKKLGSSITAMPAKAKRKFRLVVLGVKHGRNRNTYEPSYYEPTDPFGEQELDDFLNCRDLDDD